MERILATVTVAEVIWTDRAAKTARWAAALALALLAVFANTASALLLDYFGPIIVLPLSLWTFTGVGVILALRRPRHPLGWLFLVSGATWTLWFTIPGYAWRALVEAPGSLPGGELAAWLSRASFVPAVAATLSAVVLFPTGRLPSRRFVPAFVLAGAALGATIIVVSFSPDPTMLSGPWFPEGNGPVFRRAIPNPFAASGSLGEALLAVKPVLLTATRLPLVILTLGTAVFRFSRSSGVERLQIKWSAYAASFSLILLMFGFGLPKSDVGNLAWASGMAALGLIPLGAGIAILRYRLFDIDLLIGRSLSYAALSGVVVALYLVTVTFLGALLRQPDDPLVSAGAALLVAVLFTPLRVRVQRAVDRVVYGDRAEPYAAVGELGRRLGEILDPDSVLPTVARTVAESLRLPYVAIELNAGDGDRVVASHGRPGGATMRLPLVYQQETVGHLIVAPRAGEVTLGRQDLALLETLGRQAGIAAHGVRVTGELRRARERLVIAREEERRRLLRDLHDELGPRLASHTLLVDAARTALTRDPARADVLLADLAHETRRSLDEVRRIARGLRPPALDELGLPDALRDAAEQCTSSRLAIEVDVTNVDSTPTAVETAAYHVAREALANVVRHAEATWCAVRLRRGGDGALVLEVEDDGKGVAPGTPSGLGFESMRERSAEVGGHCVIADRPAGGTHVTAVFPFGGAA